MKEAKAEFSEAREQLFADHPLLKTISITGSTPAWNDGEACVYRVNRDAVINGYSEWDDAEEDVIGENVYELSEKHLFNEVTKEYDIPNEKYSPEATKAVKAVEKFLESFDDDFFEEEFGDGVRITMTARKVETDDYCED